MEGRGAQARKDTKLKIVAALLQKECGILELSKITDTARATVADLVRELIDERLLERVTERTLTVSSSCCVVVMEIYREYIEIMSYYLKDHKCERVHLRAVWALNFEDNILRVVSTLERHLRDLRSNGYTVYSAAMCINCRSKIGATGGIELVAQRSEMISSYLKAVGCDDSLLYVDEADQSADLYSDCKHIGTGASNVTDIEGNLETFLSFFKPSALMLEHKKPENFEKLKEICLKNSIKLTLWDRSKITPAEFGLILALFEKHII